MPNNEAEIVVFWSWQSDSPADANRTFIEKCLSKACKSVAKDHAIIITVDRDTRGVGGSPAIAETILAKIRSADVFVWDATFVTLTPKAAPNPNVLFELGYAFAVLGEGRLIGVMNTSGIPEGTPLPFDLNHRRWPIKYNLAHGTTDREAIQAELTADFVAALKAALKEPKLGVHRSDVDLHASQSLWKSLDSEWLRNWYEAQCTSPQYERRETLTVMGTYIRLAEKPENHFKDEKLAGLHDAVVSAMENYLSVSGTQRVPDGNSHHYVISTKAARGFVEDYDAKYDRQLKLLETAVERLWAAWKAYVNELRTRYPEVTTSVNSSDRNE
ncbi:hypothetical protein WME95_02510 [Sorangium sp. So ce327]|uniref:hypothetical protein n=1 Tax=Sorangium sp. So ce327 TaxID=3133301 RepID=UPI003F605EA4